MIGLYLFAFLGLAPIGGLFAGWLAQVGGTTLASPSPVSFLLRRSASRTPAAPADRPRDARESPETAGSRARRRSNGAGYTRPGMAGDHVAIALEGVSKRFGKAAAVRDVTLAIREGEFFSLLVRADAERRRPCG